MQAPPNAIMRGALTLARNKALVDLLLGSRDSNQADCYIADTSKRKDRVAAALSIPSENDRIIS
jgi:hypothetical protein